MEGSQKQNGQVQKFLTMITFCAHVFVWMSMMGGSPIIWKSNVQPIITPLSTMESEYVTLSTTCKELIPLQRAAKEIAKACRVLREERASSMHTTI